MLSLLSISIVLMSGFSASEAQNRIQTVWPLTEAFEMVGPALANVIPEPYLERHGKVLFAVDTFFPKSAETGIRTAAEQSFGNNEISISFFSDKQYDIRITGETRPQQDVLALNGQIADQSISTFSLTVTAEYYLLSLQDLNSGMIYRVSGDMHTGIGQVRKINPSKMPPIKYSPPLIPPLD